MNLSIAITAARQGACVANYCEVTKLIVDKPALEDMGCRGPEIVGAEVVDTQTGGWWKNR